MNETKIIAALYQNLYPSVSVMCGRYTPPGWWECDVYAITKAGYGVEYEIKRTRQDFHLDKTKRKGSGVYKHDLLANGDERAPSRFYYVTPKGLLSLDEIPEWAGLIEFSDSGAFVLLDYTKKATRIHSEKVGHRAPELYKTFYYRYWLLFMKQAMG